jgi:tetratricopeptide (TPR) repeat protein
MISIPAAYTDTHRISMPPETVPTVADATLQDAASKSSPQAALAEKEAIILLDTLRRAKAATQDSAFPITGKDAARVRDNLKMLIGLAENRLTGSGPALKAAGITGFTAPPASKPMEPAQNLQQSKSAGLGAIGDRLAAAGKHTEAVMLYMAADMNLAERTDMRYLVSTGKSLLALGQAEQAEEAFLLALQQNAKNGSDLVFPENRAELDGLLLTARTAIAEGAVNKGTQASDSPAATQSPTRSTHRLNEAMHFISVDEPNFDIDYLLSELGQLQHDTSQTRVASQQGAIQRNRDSREGQIKQKLEAMEANNKAKAEHDAAAKKAGFWSKLSMALSVATAVLGLMLAPFTGGLSLIGTAFLVADLALELGEYFTGIEMSLQTNLQKVCVLIVDEVLKGIGSPEAHQLVAAVLALVLNVVLMVVLMKMSMGKAVSNLAKATRLAKEAETGMKAKPISTIKKATNYAVDVGGKRLPQLMALSGALTSIYGGGCAYDAAVAGFELNASDVQQADIEKRQVKLDKLFEQLIDDLKLVAKELQRDMELLAEVLSGNIENRQKTITALFHRPNPAA